MRRVEEADKVDDDSPTPRAKRRCRRTAQKLALIPSAQPMFPCAPAFTEKQFEELILPLILPASTVQFRWVSHAWRRMSIRSFQLSFGRKYLREGVAGGRRVKSTQRDDMLWDAISRMPRLECLWLPHKLDVISFKTLERLKYLKYLELPHIVISSSSANPHIALKKIKTLGKLHIKRVNWDLSVADMPHVTVKLTQHLPLQTLRVLTLRQIEARVDVPAFFKTIGAHPNIVSLTLEMTRKSRTSLDTGDTNIDQLCHLKRLHIEYLRVLAPYQPFYFAHLLQLTQLDALGIYTYMIELPSLPVIPTLCVKRFYWRARRAASVDKLSHVVHWLNEASHLKAVSLTFGLDPVQMSTVLVSSVQTALADMLCQLVHLHSLTLTTSVFSTDTWIYLINRLQVPLHVGHRSKVYRSKRWVSSDYVSFPVGKLIGPLLKRISQPMHPYAVGRANN